MPYYGDLLHEMTEGVRGPSGRVLERGGGSESDFSEIEAAMLRTFVAQAGATDEEIRKELDKEVVDRGPANWEWVQGAGRWISKKFPKSGKMALPLVQQVDSYLTRPHITNAVDSEVGIHLKGKPSVVVAHSLGTIVSYKLLRHYAGDSSVKLYVTLGSPLGIDIIKEKLKPPALIIPDGVIRWVNGADERDYVALHAGLNKETFADGIENFTDIQNSKNDPHSIFDYLSDHRIATVIRDALV